MQTQVNNINNNILIIKISYILKQNLNLILIVRKPYFSKIYMTNKHTNNLINSKVTTKFNNMIILFKNDKI